MQGSVSIMAHSLGSVLSYDVLCNQPHLYAALNLPKAHSPDAVQQSKRARLSHTDSQVLALLVKPLAAVSPLICPLLWIRSYLPVCQCMLYTSRKTQC